jgi:hypothetical protein
MIVAQTADTREEPGHTLDIIAEPRTTLSLAASVIYQLEYF